MLNKMISKFAALNEVNKVVCRTFNSFEEFLSEKFEVNENIDREEMYHQLSELNLDKLIIGNFLSLFFIELESLPMDDFIEKYSNLANEVKEATSEIETYKKEEQEKLAKEQIEEDDQDQEEEEVIREIKPKLSSNGGGVKEKIAAMLLQSDKNHSNNSVSNLHLNLSNEEEGVNNPNMIPRINYYNNPNNNPGYNNLLKKYKVFEKEIVASSVVKPTNTFNFDANYENEYKKFNKVKESTRQTKRDAKDDWYNQIFKEAFGKKNSNPEINIHSNAFSQGINSPQGPEIVTSSPENNFVANSNNPQLNILNKKLSEMLESKPVQKSSSNLININFNNVNNYGQINAVTNISQVINIIPPTNNNLIESMSSNTKEKIKNKVNEVYKDLNRVTDNEVWNCKDKFKEKYLNLQKLKKKNDEKNYFIKEKKNQDYFLEIYNNVQAQNKKKGIANYGKNESLSIFKDKLNKLSSKSSSNKLTSSSSNVKQVTKPDGFFDFSQNPKKLLTTNNVMMPYSNLDKLKKNSLLVKEDIKYYINKEKMSNKINDIENIMRNFDRILTPNNLDKSSSFSSLGRVNRMEDDGRNWSDFEMLLDREPDYSHFNNEPERDNPKGADLQIQNLDY